MRTHALWVLLLSSIPALSQTCCNSLCCTVTDLHDGSCLSGASLFIGTAKTPVVTDHEGKFTFSNLCKDTYVVTVMHPYCQTTTFKIEVKGQTSKTLRLEHHLEELNQIIIEGKKQGHTSKTLQKQTLSKKTLEAHHNSSIGDALSNLSGVSSLKTGSTIAKPLINGLHSSRVVTISNGVRMEAQEWGVEHAPNLDINSIGSLTLIKGAGALQYSGDALGGVIIAEAPKAPVKDSLYGKTLFTMASNGRGSTLSSELTKSTQSGWHATAQGTLKHFGDFEAPDYLLSNTGLSEHNASFSVGLNRFNHGIEAYYSLFKTDIGILRAAHLGNSQDLNRAINSTTPLIINDFSYRINAPKQAVTHHLAKIKGFKEFERFGKLTLQYDFQRNQRLEYDIRRGADRDKASMDLELDTHTLMLDLETHLHPVLQLKTGIMGRHQNNFADPKTGVRRLIPDFDKFDLGMYAIADFQLDDQWLLEAGMRFDYTSMDVFKYYYSSFWENRNYDQLYPELVVEEFKTQILTRPQLNYKNGSGTFGATYSFNEAYKLFLHCSIAARAPNPSELFSEGLHHSAARIELGDLRFNSEIGRKASLTFQRHRGTFTFSVSPYINTISDFILIEPTGSELTIRGAFPVWEYRQTNAQLLGLDADASVQFSKTMRFNHQSSLVKGYDRTRKQPLISMPPVNTSNEIVYQNTACNNLQLSLQSAYFFRQNEYPNNNFDLYIPATKTWETLDVSTPPQAYHLLNLNASIEFKTTQTGTLTLGLGITNLLNRSYRNYLNRLRYYADDLGRNFLLNLKLNY